MIKVHCSKCGKPITLGEEFIGATVTCPFCQQKLAISNPVPPVAAPPEPPPAQGPDYVIMEKGVPLPAGYERRLSNGALVVFGPHALDTAASLRNEGHSRDQMIVCSEAASDLLLPDTLMIWSMLIFDHAIRGEEGVPSSEEGLSAWSRELLGGLSFASGSEPVPKISMTMDQEKWGVLLTLQWMPPESGPWNGVKSGQVKRAALALEAAYKKALGRGAVAEGGNTEPEEDATPAKCTMLEHDGRIESVSISPDGRFALSGGGEGNLVCLWDLESGAEIRRFETEGKWLTSVAFLGNSGQIAVLGDCSFSVWDCTTGERVSEDFGRMSQMCVSSDGRFVLLGHEHGEAELRDTGKKIAVGSFGDPYQAHSGNDVQAVALSSGITHALTASQEEVKLWKIDARKAEECFNDRQWGYEIGRLLHRYEDTWIFGVRRMAFLPGGREAIVLSGKVPLLIDLQNGGVTGRFEAGVLHWNDFAISADGRRIAVAHNTDEGNFVSVLDLAGRRKILTFEEHQGVVTSVAISADGRRVVSGSDDEAVRVWNI